MGKRSNFDRISKDKYMTWDPRPVRVLQRHLPPRVAYAEPCAGNGDLVKSMAWYGHQCVYACDIQPGRGRDWIMKRDALTLDKSWRRRTRAQMFVTNTPWSRAILHDLIEHLSALLPLWILLDADYMHTKQAGPYLDKCSHIVSAGRVRWIKDSSDDGVDNVAWYFFPHREHTGGPRFTGLLT